MTPLLYFFVDHLNLVQKKFKPRERSPSDGLNFPPKYLRILNFLNFIYFFYKNFNQTWPTPCSTYIFIYRYSGFHVQGFWFSCTGILSKTILCTYRLMQYYIEIMLAVTAGDIFFRIFNIDGWRYILLKYNIDYKFYCF